MPYHAGRRDRIGVWGAMPCADTEACHVSSTQLDVCYRCQFTTHSHKWGGVSCRSSRDTESESSPFIFFPRCVSSVRSHVGKGGIGVI